MEESPVDKKALISGGVFSILMILIVFFSTFFDRRTKIVFCDVGQGDGVYIRIKNKIDLLVDAGPDKKILNCLGRHMPFYDRKIELVIVSHPQKDHFGGLLYLFDRYQVEKMLMTPLNNPSQSFKRLKEKAIEKKIGVDFPKAGMKIKILDDRLFFYWPTEEFLMSNLSFSRNYPVAGGRIDNVLGTSTIDDNNFSLIFLFQEENFKALFTGDTNGEILEKVLKKYRLKINVLKIPHHGSKNGLSKNILQLADPEVGVISAGKNNPHGHPTKKVLAMLQALKIQIRRTDMEGDIVFKLKVKSDE